MLDEMDYLDSLEDDEVDIEKALETERVMMHLAGLIGLKDAAHCTTVIMSDWSEDDGSYYYEIGTHIVELYYRDWIITEDGDLFQAVHKDQFESLLSDLPTLLDAIAGQMR